MKKNIFKILFCQQCLENFYDKDETKIICKDCEMKL